MAPELLFVGASRLKELLNAWFDCRSNGVSQLRDKGSAQGHDQRKAILSDKKRSMFWTIYSIITVVVLIDAIVVWHFWHM